MFFNYSPIIFKFVFPASSLLFALSFFDLIKIRGWLFYIVKVTIVHISHVICNLGNERSWFVKCNWGHNSVSVCVQLHCITSQSNLLTHYDFLVRVLEVYVAFAPLSISLPLFNLLSYLTYTIWMLQAKLPSKRRHWLV